MKINTNVVLVKPNITQTNFTKFDLKFTAQLFKDFWNDHIPHVSHYNKCIKYNLGFVAT